jgi:hypothetical protein
VHPTQKKRKKGKKKVILLFGKEALSLTHHPVFSKKKNLGLGLGFRVRNRRKN